MSFPVPQTSEGAQEATKKAVENAEERKAFFSFGDEGVTATVGENGRLLRISRYFPGEKTGFCVDDPRMPEPCGGIGPSIDGSPTETIVNHLWPTFKGPWTNNTHSATSFKLQYIAHNGTIYQRFVFSSNRAITNGGGQANPALPPKLQVDANLLLRSLDFVDGDNSFNKASPSDRFPYTSSYGKNHLVREHVHGTKAIRLFIHALNESNSAEFVKVDESEEEGFVYTVRPEPAGGETIPNDKPTSTTFTIILAYTLQYAPVEENTNFLPPGWRTITTTMDELLESRNEHSLTENLDPTLDFFLGRNLEYILYAFQTLLLALMHFRDAAMSAQLLCETDPSRPSQTTLDYIFEMDRRISRVCSGHIEWVFHKAVISGGLHCPNYWVSGEQISEWWKNQYLPKGCLANAPFQILKACDFLELAQRYNLQFQLLLKEIKVPIESWVEGLDEINRLGRYAFPREDSGPTNSFYLTDHALIWRTIRSLETVYPHWKFKGPKSKLPYSSQIIQHNMIKRFTTENPQSNKRMIAATRSAIQTRFLLEANDTSLFPALEKGLFDVPQKGRQGMSRHCRNQLWTNTIDCQKFHEDNEDFHWCDPRKFALSIMMAHLQICG
ncbi:hypothetical protein K456DRAFT_1935456 [Colletotrichum gloeosporioides 23]|nr:hypothetical protein K456DRAFT_1935456 [Colletotrichum gloeosporioides 23]